MKTICECDKATSFLLGKQDFEPSKEYRPLSYLVFAEHDERILVSNMLTCELIIVDTHEAELLRHGTVYLDDDAKKLVEHWFLVPVEHDDYALCEEIRFFLRHVNAHKKGLYKSYVVMTTTDCNARCFYCYQMGRNKSRIPMSDETANKLVEFMTSHAPENEPLRITWYGGEPLYNERVIDIICDGLRKNNVDFKSSMISNAYLITDEVVYKAKNKWNLSKINIAIDGTEDVYNKCKAYIHKDDSSPYQRVMENIKKVLCADIAVNIRVNIDNHNVSNIFALADELHLRFSEYDKFNIYGFGLYENSGPNNPRRNDETRLQLTQNLISFEEYCEKKGILSALKYRKSIKTNRCMADRGDTLTVTPEGNLGLCDHMTGTDIVGTLDTDITDFNLVSLWQERLNTRDTCEKCPVFPHCIRLKKCPDDGIAICDEAYKTFKYYQAEKTLLNEYISYKKRNT